MAHLNLEVHVLEKKKRCKECEQNTDKQEQPVA